MAQKRISRRLSAPPLALPPATLWQALNEPIAYPTQEFGTSLVAIAVLLLGFVWLQPNFASSSQGLVAGAISTNYISQTTSAQARSASSWYLALASTSENLGNVYQSGIQAPLGTAAQELLDVSEPVAQTVEFLQPGVDKVLGPFWNAWLELLSDPY